MENGMIIYACEIILQLSYKYRWYYWEDLKKLWREDRIVKNRCYIAEWVGLSRSWLEFGKFDICKNYGYDGSSYFPLISEFIEKQKERNRGK